MQTMQNVNNKKSIQGIMS